MRYGFSLSFCISGILSGKVPEEEVGGIRTSTKFPNVEAAITHYYDIYWCYHGQSREDVTKLLYRLWSIIDQPRLRDEDFEQNIAHCLRNPWYEAKSMREAIDLFTFDPRRRP